MKINNKFLLVVLLFLGSSNVQYLAASVCCDCSDVSSCSTAQQAYKDTRLLGHLFDKHWDCNSFLVKYSPYRNFMAVLMIDKGNNGYKIEIFDTYTKQKIFDFEPMTMPINDFILREDRIIVHFADAYGSQIAYDIYTGEMLWST